MDAFAKVVLILFIFIRVLIATGLVYLIYYEVRKIKKTRKIKEEVDDGQKVGKHTDSSSRSRG
jgi:predicted membrane protein